MGAGQTKPRAPAAGMTDETRAAARQRIMQALQAHRLGTQHIVAPVLVHAACSAEQAQQQSTGSAVLRRLL